MLILISLHESTSASTSKSLPDHEFRQITITGDPGSKFGVSSGVGDVNNDGYDDFAVGQVTDGISSLFFGKPSNEWKSDLERADASATLGFNTDLCDPGFYPDWWCVSLPFKGGNFNGDQYDDFVTISTQIDKLKGGTMVYLGRETELWRPDAAISQMNTTFIGENDNDRTGYGATGVGDVNKDGFDDIIIGGISNDEGETNAGQTYLILGNSSFNWNGVYPLSMSNASFIGENFGEYSAAWVSKAGDMNGDGYDDFAIGSLNFVAEDTKYRKISIIFGRATEKWEMDVPLFQANVSFIDDEVSSCRAGCTSWRFISDVGDVNNDGFDDLVIGNYHYEETYLIFGRPNELWLPEYRFSQSNTTFQGEFRSLAQSGFAVAGIGDTNGDNYDDFLVGAPKYEDKGRVYLILGRPTSQWPLNMSLNNANAIFDGTDVDGMYGWDVSEAGDVDNNGLQDFLISAATDPFSYDANSIGKAYLYLSIDRSDEELVIPWINDNSTALAIISLSTLGLGGLIYYTSVRPKGVESITINAITKNTVKEIFNGNTAKYLLLAGNLKRDEKYGSATNIPPELFEYKLLLHPVRMAMMKVLIDNPIMTSVELKEYLNLNWSEFRSQMAILKKLKYIYVREEFIDNSVKQAISVEEHGLNEFNKLSKIMLEFFGSPDYDAYLRYLDT